MFKNDTGYAVTVKAVIVEDGSAKLPVPLSFNAVTELFASHNVTLSIPNGKETAFVIDDLPDLSDMETGLVVKEYLQALANNLIDSLADLDVFAVEYNHDVTGLKTQIQL